MRMCLQINNYTIYNNISSHNLKRTYRFYNHNHVNNSLISLQIQKNRLLNSLRVKWVKVRCKATHSPSNTRDRCITPKTLFALQALSKAIKEILFQIAKTQCKLTELNSNSNRRINSFHTINSKVLSLPICHHRAPSWLSPQSTIINKIKKWIKREQINQSNLS